MRKLYRALCVVLLAGCTSAPPGAEKEEPFLRPKLRSATEDAAPRYTYGAKFEPPEGRILHGMGQYQGGNEAYLEMLGDESFYPISSLSFIRLADQPRPWPYIMRKLQGDLEEAARGGWIPHIDIGFATDAGEGVDDVFARTEELDARAWDVAAALKRFGKPVFLRIGGEFNGEWNGYHPFDYPRAFQKIVGMFRSRDVENVAFIWCYMPSADDDFDARNLEGEYKWFPGEDVIDWFGIDVFAVHHFSPGKVERGRGPSAWEKTVRFLEMAGRYAKPVIVAESSATKLDIVPDPRMGDRYWSAFFEPFFEFIRNAPGIRAFHYINYDWTESPRYRSQGWTCGRVDRNPRLGRRYRKEMEKSCYLHRGSGRLLKDYDLYR